MKKFSDFSKNWKKVNEQEEKETPLAKLTGEENPKKEENEEQGSTGPAKFFSKLFESREMAHVYHLQVRGDEGSYAAHMALGTYYDNILGFIDDLIEIYQGQYDIIDGYDIIDTSTTKSKDKVEYFKEVAEFIKAERKCISAEDTHLHNIIDEVLALVYKTLYKLRFNK
jgi:hypothetical protein